MDLGCRMLKMSEGCSNENKNGESLCDRLKQSRQPITGGGVEVGS